MTTDDAICVLETLDRLRPAYAEWRSEQARKLAASHGTKPVDENRAMLASIARSWADVTTEEAATVVEEMEAGKLPIPFWGEMASTVRTAAMADRQGRRDADRYQRETERRLHCLDCQDRGWVMVYNPRFVEELRYKFAAWRETESFPDGWYKSEVDAW